MRKTCSPQELAISLTKRSTCAVQVASVIWDNWGIFAWGNNSAGSDGFGEHAEAHAIRRANKSRLNGASIAVAGRRKRNGKIVVSLPCTDCANRVSKWGIKWVWIESREGLWQRISI